VLYRIDLRDYGWDRPIDLGEEPPQLYADGWLAIVAGLSALELTGPQADVVTRWSGTHVPLLQADFFIQLALQASLYYALTGLPASSSREESLFDLLRAQGVELQAPAPGNVARAGFALSPGSEEAKRVSRFVPAGSPDTPWWLLDQGSDLLRQPLLPFQGGYFLYRLPNGMPAFAVAQQQGRVLAQAPYNSFEFSSPTGAIVGAGCFGCHGAGVIAVPDEVRPLALQQPQRFENSAAVLVEYLGAAALEQATEFDNMTFVAARRGAGVLAATPDPISRVFQRFSFAGVSLPTAAGELGVTPDELLAVLPLLDHGLASLGAKDASVDRSPWQQSYHDAACRLSTGWQNQPVNCKLR